MENNKRLAQLLFSDVKISKEEIEKKYPLRDKNTVVTRFAPSPTGFLHIGGVYTCLINRKIATQNNGKFILRIEDTDKKREVANSKGIIVNCLNRFGIKIDEGVNGEDTQIGEYGSYIQSERTEIYHSLAKYLVEKGFAYPCFCTEDELNEIREKQAIEKVSPGYYGSWAKYRDYDINEVEKLINNHTPYVLRFRVPDMIEERVGIEDSIKGSLEMENNRNDFVLLKENGIPTYHFAHACDDHLMGTTIVIRGDEWISSLPIHLQLFNALEYDAPSYAHVAPVMKLDGESRRKLSKRKDPESNAEYYLENGYPIKALYVYLYTLINSNFEEWYTEHKGEDLDNFTFTYEAMSKNGALYDLDKLKNISSEIIYETDHDSNLSNLLDWAKEYSPSDYELFTKYEELVKKIMMTQGPDSNENRKDLSHYGEFMNVFGFFFDEIFEKDTLDFMPLLLENINKCDIKEVLGAMITFFKEKENGSEKTFKELSDELKYTNKKKFDKSPSEYRGVVFQFYHIIRICLTHQASGIGLDDIIDCLGYSKVIKRLELILERGE